MIFINHKRIIQNSGVKDPTNYWYIEKYVYGVLKETVEVPLGTGTTFSAIDSGYDDDTFYGWSISSTSNARKFNNTSSYSNTTTAVKNNLDENNTLKLYAVYSYYEYGTPLSSEALIENTSSISYSFRVMTSGTFYFTGRTITTGQNVSGSVSSSSGISIDIYDASDKHTCSFTTNKDGSTKYSIYIEAGHRFSFTLKGGSESGQYYSVNHSSSLSINTNRDEGTFSYFTGPYYRVESHT